MRIFTKLKYLIRGKRYSYEGVKLTKDNIVQFTIDDLKKSVINWIKINVPKRTGQLQDNLIDYIEKNWHYKEGFTTLDLYTNVDYAFDIVNPKHYNTWLEHSGIEAIADYGGHTGKILLHDPMAIANWQNVLAGFVLEEFKKILTININKVVGI